MNYLLKGDPKEVAKVLQENRIRVERGVIEFTPAQPEAALDADSVATLREVLDAKTKECVEMAADQLELANLTEAVVDILVEEGIAIPDDLSAHLAKFITVPKSAETVPDDSVNVENADSNVPETVLNEPEAVEDSKTVDAEDMTEVNLDDIKDEPLPDTKAAPATTPKKKRTKKSE